MPNNQSTFDKLTTELATALSTFAKDHTPVQWASLIPIVAEDNTTYTHFILEVFAPLLLLKYRYVTETESVVKSHLKSHLPSETLKHIRSVIVLLNIPFPPDKSAIEIPIPRLR